VKSVIWEECHSSLPVRCGLLDVLSTGAVVEGLGLLLR
jgi:hypothetical protein